MSKSEYTQEAVELADAILRASGSSLGHYNLPNTRRRLFITAQKGIDSAQKELLEALEIAFPIINLRLKNRLEFEDQKMHPLTKELSDAIDVMCAAIAKARGETSKTEVA